MQNKNIKHEELDGKHYAVILQPKGESLTLTCPFCNKYHSHGIGEGHRRAHCSDTSFPPFNWNNDRIIMYDGISLFQKDGYIIRTV